MLVETIVTLIFLAIVGYAPRADQPSPHERAAEAIRRGRGRSRRIRDSVIGVIAGGAAFLVVWASLSRPTPDEGVISEQIKLTPLAHGGDVVTVILADFRGLDTMVEISVIGVAVFGVISLLRAGRAW